MPMAREGNVSLTGHGGGAATFRFCPNLRRVYYDIGAMPGMPGMIAVPVGAFADPTFTRTRTPQP